MSERLRFVDENKEKLVAAWIAQHGYEPGDCCLITQVDKCWVAPKFTAKDRPQGGALVSKKEFEAALEFLWQQSGRTPEASKALNDIRLFVWEKEKGK